MFYQSSRAENAEMTPMGIDEVQRLLHKKPDKVDKIMQNHRKWSEMQSQPIYDFTFHQ